MNPQYLPKSSERKRVNPLIDLVETEKIYISDLRCLLKRVTSCWSSEDLPPPELDTLFRAIEEIYKRNKQFYSKLAKYGTSPQSAEVLGDALMAWVDEMEEPYKNYCQKPRQGFNKREDIEENLVLQQTLNDISAENNQPVSLDYFFDIPIKRLHYYKKLYMRLFKSTEPGRSDHIILASANERIDQIIKLEKQVKQSYLKNPINSSQRLYPTVPTPSLSPSPSVEERAVTPTKDQGFHSSPVQEPEFHSPLLERLQQNQERTVTPVKDQGFRSSPVQEPEFHSPLLERLQQNQERTVIPTKDQGFRSSPVQEPEFHSPLLERLQQNQERTVTPVKDQGFRSSPVQEPEFHSPLLERLQQNQERTVTPTKDQGFRSSPVQEPEFHSPLLERLQQNQERTVTPVKDQGFRSSPVQEPEFHSPLLERLQQNQERTVTPTKDQGFRSSPVQEPEFHSPLLERLQQNQEHIITPTKDRSSPVQEPEFHSPLLERLQQNQEHIITPTKDQGFHSNYSTVQEPEFHSPLPLRIQQDHIHSPMPQRLHSPISPMQDYESSFSGYFPETSEDSQSNWSILDLQNFIDTSRTFDILTKQPRKVNLVLQPPNLPFNREIVLYEDFVIEVPEYDSDERFHVRAHLFLLTDLLLVCQKIEPKDQKSISNFKYWLMYQPLSGKHLSIRDTSYEEGAMLELTIMRDETLIIYPQTDDVKDTWFREISNAIKFASVGSMRPQVNTDVKNLNSAGSSPRTLSPSPNTGVLTPNSSGSRSRSPTNSRLSPTNSRLSPTNSGLSPNNNNNMGHSPIGSRKPGLPTRPNQYLGTSNGRSQALDIQRKSSDESIYKPSNDNNNNNNNHNQIQQDRISDPSSPNSVYRSQSLNSLKRSNSISSLKSVASIAVMREKIFESSPCQIFYWINGNWKPLTTKDLCIVEVRVTTMNKGCWAILLQKTNRMILNAWIHSNTIIERNSPTTISISCEMGLNKEFYRVSMSIPEEADRFFANLNKVKQIPLENSNNLLLPPQGLISRSSSLQSLQRNDSLNREVEKSSKLAMECRCRLFLQNDHGIWTNLGWGKMQLEIESPSQRRKLVVNSEKQNKKLVDAILREDGVERVGRAGVAITLNSIDPANSKRIIYMMQMKEEAMAVKAYKIMKQGRY